MMQLLLWYTLRTLVRVIRVPLSFLSDLLSTLRLLANDGVQWTLNYAIELSQNISVRHSELAKRTA